VTRLLDSHFSFILFSDLSCLTQPVVWLMISHDLLCRLLYGTLHVRAYDWVASADSTMADCSASPVGSPARSSSSSGSGKSSITAEFGLGGSCVQPARLVTDRVLTAPADTMVLFPASG